MSEEKSIIRKMIIPLLKIFGLYSLAQLRDRGPLVEVGWFRSFKEKKPVDKSGNPLPWFSYPMIYFLEKRVQPAFSVFEFGAGNSTLWWAKRVLRVVTCEHDPAWFHTVKKSAPSNTTVLFIENSQEDYIKTVKNVSEKFDIIVIDGNQRVQCIKESLPSLKPDGIIILDDSDRPEYAEGIQYLRDQGFRHIEFYGNTACVNVGKETSVFYRTKNCLNI